MRLLKVGLLIGFGEELLIGGIHHVVNKFVEYHGP